MLIRSRIPARSSSHAVAMADGVRTHECGGALFWARSAALAARVLFVSLLVWLFLFRLPNRFYEKPLVLVGWTFGSTAVMVAEASILSMRLGREHERARLGFLADSRGVRIARVLYGVSLIPFGLAHFMYPDATTVLIPNWLPQHLALAFFTGATFIAAGLGVALGVMGRLAAALSTQQMALFGIIVWVPRVLSGSVNEFQLGEFVVTFVLMAGALVVTESYGRAAWLASDLALGGGGSPAVT